MEEQLVVIGEPWKDKYERLHEAHEKLQKLNQNLEEKLLKIAEEHQEKATKLSNQAQELTCRLVEARLLVNQLEDENERYRNDINVVIQLLQCKPSNFISPKIDKLPEDFQKKVLGQKNGTGRKDKKIIKVQVPVKYHSSADIMYSVDNKVKGKRNYEKDVSAAIMAKVLQERENERNENQKNRKCYPIILPTLTKETQTVPCCTIDFVYPDDMVITTNFSPHFNKLRSYQYQHRSFSPKITNLDEDEELLINPNTPPPPLSAFPIHQSSSSELSSPSSNTSLYSSNILNSNSMISNSKHESGNNDFANLNVFQYPAHPTRKLAGHCVRVIDEKDDKEQAHWRTTVRTVVGNPPKIMQDNSSGLNNNNNASSNTNTTTNLNSHSPTTSSSSISIDNNNIITNISGNNHTQTCVDELTEESPLTESVVYNYSSHNILRSTGIPYSNYHTTTQQSYRKKFWTRSSSTTSTETEI